MVPEQEMKELQLAHGAAFRRVLSAASAIDSLPYGPVSNAVFVEFYEEMASAAQNLTDKTHALLERVSADIRAGG